MEQELIVALSELKMVIVKFNYHEISKYELCDECYKVFKALEEKGIKLNSN